MGILLKNTRFNLKSPLIIGTKTLPPYTVVLFTTSGTWIKPAGVQDVIVECWGGGGAGGGATTNLTAGSGGAGGQYAVDFLFYPSAQQSIPYTVAASVAGTTGNGATGNDTTWNTSEVIAKGGAGGLANQSAFPGTMTLGSTVGGVGTTVNKGGDGSFGYQFNSGVQVLYQGFGGGGAGSTGDGGNASAGASFGSGTSDYGGNGGQDVGGGGGPTPIDINGTAGSNYGGGGSGGARTSTTNRTGGAGAPGLIRLSYLQIL